MVENKGHVGRVAGVVETRSAIRLIAATAENQKIGRPSTTLGFGEKPRHVVRADRSFQSVQKNEGRRAYGCRRSRHRVFPTVHEIPEASDADEKTSPRASAHGVPVPTMPGGRY